MPAIASGNIKCRGPFEAYAEDPERPGAKFPKGPKDARFVIKCNETPAGTEAYANVIQLVKDVCAKDPAVDTNEALEKIAWGEDNSLYTVGRYCTFFVAADNGNGEPDLSKITKLENPHVTLIEQRRFQILAFQLQVQTYAKGANGKAGTAAHLGECVVFMMTGPTCM